MEDYGTPDLIGAWIITQLWDRKPRWSIRLEMASAALPVKMDERDFNSGWQILVVVGVIDRKGNLTPLGREAMAFPGPGASSYREKFKAALARLQPNCPASNDAENVRSCLIVEFADFIYLVEAARRRLA